MRAKDYLISKGLAKPGRGRISLAGHEALKAAIASGMSFSDYPKGNSLPAEPVPAKVERVPVKKEREEIPVIVPETFPMDSFRAFEREDGKLIERSLREVCTNCRVSLVQCECGHPEIVSRNPLRGPSHVPVILKERR